jgi:hypothetical protein
MKLRFVKLALGITAVVAGIVTFSACDLFDKATTITIPADLEVVWEADENAEGTDVVYNLTHTVSLADNADVAKHIDKIKEIKVESITYRVTDYNDDPHGEAVIFKDGVASFSAKGSSTSVLSVPYAASASGVNLKTTTTDKDLTIDADGLNDLAAIFKQDKELDMKVTGKLSRTPASFKLISVFHVKITADVVD